MAMETFRDREKKISAETEMEGEKQDPGTVVTASTSTILVQLEDPYDDNTPENKKLVWKQDVRIMPLSAFVYLLCYLDRANIGNAKVMNSETKNDLKTELSMNDSEFSIALMLFLIAYAVFDIPSNYLLKRMTPSRWLAFLMFSWGTITIGMGGVKNFATLTVTRFLLGAFESGLFPGLIYYLTFWYRPNERSVRIGIILASSALSGLFGGLIAYGISYMNQFQSLSGWRWLFIIEGLPSCISGIAVWFWLPDYPETATWMSEDERRLAKERMWHNGSHSESRMTWEETKKTLRDWRLYAHYLDYFCWGVAGSSLSFFIPSIITGLGFTSLRAQLMTVTPFACAYVVTLIVGYSADRYNTRAYHTAAAQILSAIGFMVSALLPAKAYTARYGALILAASGCYATGPPMLGWISGNLHSTTAAALAIALATSCGALGQIIGVWTYKSDEMEKGYPTGHWVNVGCTLFGAFITLGLRSFYAGQNRKIRDGKLEKVYWKM